MEPRSIRIDRPSVYTVPFSIVGGRPLIVTIRVPGP
jgi:hypothetical protein